MTAAAAHCGCAPAAMRRAAAVPKNARLGKTAGYFCFGACARRAPCHAGMPTYQKVGVVYTQP